jgi:hypothetical protein
MAIAEVNGGKPPYIYSWNDLNKQTTDTAFGLYPGTFMVEVKDQDKCKVSGAATVQSVVGIPASQFNQTQSTLYPSPVHSNLFIALPTDVKTTAWTLSITDLSGKKITSVTLPGSSQHYQFNLSKIAQGTYLFHLQGDTFQEVKKVVVAHP